MVLQKKLRSGCVILQSILKENKLFYIIRLEVLKTSIVNIQGYHKILYEFNVKNFKFRFK